MSLLSERSLSDITSFRKPRVESEHIELEQFLESVWPLMFPYSPCPTLWLPLNPIGERFHSKEPEYTDDVKNLVSSKSIIEVGDSFDIISLLSFDGRSNYLVRNNGDKVLLDDHTFRGKHIMVCCFLAPIFCEHEYASFFQSLANICSENYNNNCGDGDSNFEMVVVAKMNPLANHSMVFDHFMSAFPSSCFVVPFEDSKRRDYICHYLDVTHCCKCFIVDPAGVVLLNDFPNFALYFGADAFPYTPDLWFKFEDSDHPRWYCPSTTQLQELLGCTTADVFDKIDLDGRREEVSISELNQKVVGLYLLVEGNSEFEEECSFIFTLKRIYENCRANHLDFEVVVVYLPFADCLDPEIYQHKVDAFMIGQKISWWRMPFNNSKCRRLWRLGDFCADKLIIVGPHDTYIDPFGREVMTKFGVDAYPFTRKAIIESYCTPLRKLTLESFLLYETRNYVLRGDTHVPVAELQPKSVLLYFLQDFELVGKLHKWYGLIKAVDPNFDVIVVQQNSEDMDTTKVTKQYKDNDVVDSVLPWLICPFNSKHSASLSEKLFAKCSPYDTLIGFGIDGHVRTIHAQVLLERYGPDCFPFADDDYLYKEMFARLDDLITCTCL